MMFRLVRFLIITLTLGRIKWLMRLTWVWRLIVFLGVTGWLSKKIRQTIGLDKKPSTQVDSAWAEALRYTPQPATAAASASYGAAPERSPVTDSAPASEISESRSEVTGTTADGETETITIHEVSAQGDTESIVRIEDEAGNVETLVTGTPVEDLDLANLGEPATEAPEPVAEQPTLEVIEVEEIVEVEPVIDIETEAELEVIELLETLEAAEPEPEPEPSAPVVEPEKPKRRRATKVEPQNDAILEPIETTDEDPDPDVIIDPDWVRGDGGSECPDSHPVKAKASSMIYYTPENGHYERTIPDVCFASDRDAEAAGYRAPRR